jgi:hypothetical protein
MYEFQEEQFIVNDDIKENVANYDIQNLLAELEEKNNDEEVVASDSRGATLSFWYYLDDSILTSEWNECYVAYFNEYAYSISDEGYYLRIFYDGGEWFEAMGLESWLWRGRKTRYHLSELEGLLKSRWQGARKELLCAVKDGEYTPESDTLEYLQEVGLC